MSEESPSIYKLPLEVMGLILLKLDGNPSERRFEEIKKCRLISPRWYKAVQVLFQDQLFQKGLTHFDGLKHTYGQSRRFGFNIFGKFPLDFATFKISNSELYLLNNLLPQLISNNLQNLILQDNQLNMKELLKVLKMFPKIVKLEFVQSNLQDVVKKMYQLYENTGEKSDVERIEMIKNELAGSENFLRNLKIIDFKIVHASVLNFLILIISCGQCELEEISIEFNMLAIFYSVGKSKSARANDVNCKNFELEPITQLNKFSKSLKKINITALSPLNPGQGFFLGRLLELELAQDRISKVIKSIFKIFNENQLRNLNNIEELKITNKFCQSESGSGLLNFIKSQNRLSKVEVGIISESFGSSSNQGQSQEAQLQLNKTFLESFSSLGAQFGFEISTLGLNPIVQYSENLTNLIVNICPNSNWKFSDCQATFPNCVYLSIRDLRRWNENDENNNIWPNYQVPIIVKKFPNLKDLEFEACSVLGQVSNEDFQCIIKNLPKLETLYANCVCHLDDTGLTGLTNSAVKARKKSPKKPLKPRERPGLPISHLKNLVELWIWKCYIRRIGNQRRDPNPNKITDLTPTYGFEHEAPKLKILYIGHCDITDKGKDVLKTRLPSNCRFMIENLGLPKKR